MAMANGTPQTAFSSSAGAIGPDTIYILAVRWQNGGAASQYINNLLNGTHAGPINVAYAGSPSFNVGKNVNEWFMHGDLAELLFYSRSLVDADRQTIYDWLDSVYRGPVPSPDPAYIYAGDTQVFTATAGAGPPYSWAFVTNATGGSIASDGTYVAGPIFGLDTLRVTDGAGKSYDFDVTVVTPPPVRGGLLVHLTHESLASLGVGSVIARWPDSSGNSRHADKAAASEDSTYSPETSAGRPATTRGAVNLPSTWLEIPDSAALRPTSGTIVAVCRNRSLVPGANQVIASKWVNDPWGWRLVYVSDGGFHAAIGDGVASDTAVRGAGDPNNDVWNVMMQTFAAGAGVSIYQDGTLRQGPVGTRTIDYSANPGSLRIGRNVGEWTWNGWIAEFLYYNRVLTAAERDEVNDHLLEKYQIKIFDPFSPTKISDALPARGTSVGQVWFDQTFSITFEAGGEVWLFREDDAWDRALITDDGLNVTVTHPDSSVASFDHDYNLREGLHYENNFNVTELFQPGVNQARVRLRDIYGTSFSSTAYWFIVVSPPPAGEPSFGLPYRVFALAGQPLAGWERLLRADFLVAQRQLRQVDPTLSIPLRNVQGDDLAKAWPQLRRAFLAWEAELARRWGYRFPFPNAQTLAGLRRNILDVERRFP